MYNNYEVHAYRLLGVYVHKNCYNHSHVDLHRVHTLNCHCQMPKWFEMNYTGGRKIAFTT